MIFLYKLLFTDNYLCNTLDYRISGHGRLFFPKGKSTLDALIWSWTLICSWRKFQRGRLFHPWTLSYNTMSSYIVLFAQVYSIILFQCCYVVVAGKWSIIINCKQWSCLVFRMATFATFKGKYSFKEKEELLKVIKKTNCYTKNQIPHILIRNGRSE